MKNSILLTIGLAVVLAAGCSSTPSKVEGGPIRARTFSFVDGGAKPAANAGNREQIHAMIQSFIAGNLAGKGVNKVASGGDVVVAYLIVVGNNASTEMIDTYFGHGRDASELHEKAQTAYNKNKNPNYFEAGTLLVDFLDGKTYKLLKRSYVSRPVLKNASAEVRAEHIKEAVDAVLQDAHIVH